ncbi:MAG: hypothetical protein QM820_52895 [Minicystis sp.]
MRAAETAKRDDAAKSVGDDLFAAPTLAPEAGEEAAVTAAGEKKMSQENESGESPTATVSKPSEVPAPVPSQPKRQSLKEIAARASQAGARLSQPGSAPASMPSAPSSIPAPSARLSTPTPLPRPSEAGKDDSGVINLQVVQQTATAAQRAAAEKAKPAQAGLFDEEKPAEAAKAEGAKAPAEPAPATMPSNVVAMQPKKSNAGVIGGVAIAVLGLAAAFAIVSRKPATPPPAPVAQAETKPAEQPKAAPPVAATAAPTAVASAEPTPSATAEADNKTAEAPKAPTLGGPLPSGAATAGAAATGDAKVAAKGPLPSGKPGDLQSEMAKAVGKDGAAKQDQGAGPAPEPAAAGPKNQNIPEQPSQGAVAAAFGPVMGGAKACVAGADDVSRASVTFSSAGTVTSVSVSGWAAAHGQSGCVQAALKAAKVGPFSKPSFTVGVPIRP